MGTSGHGSDAITYTSNILIPDDIVVRSFVASCLASSLFTRDLFSLLVLTELRWSRLHRV